MLDTTSTSKEIRQFLLGAILGASFFLVLAGVVEIAISREEKCHRENQRMRLAANNYQVCLPEWESYFLRSTSRGIVWTLNHDAAAPLGWVIMLVFYTVLGGFCAQMPRTWGVATFLAVGLSAVAIFAGMGYFLEFIVF